MHLNAPQWKSIKETRPILVSGWQLKCFLMDSSALFSQMGFSKEIVRWHTSFKYQHNVEYHTLNAKYLRGDGKFFCIVKSLSLNPKSIVNTNKTCNCYNTVLWRWHCRSQKATLNCAFLNFSIKYYHASITKIAI